MKEGPGLSKRRRRGQKGHKKGGDKARGEKKNEEEERSRDE